MSPLTPLSEPPDPFHNPSEQARALRALPWPGVGKENVCVTHAGLADGRRDVVLRKEGAHSEAGYVDDGGAADDGKSERVPVFSAADYVRELGERNVYMHINCEGCEYQVLLDLARAGLLPCLEGLEVQMHGQKAAHVEPEAWGPMYAEIEEALKKTHRRVLDYYLVWDIWARMPDVSDECPIEAWLGGPIGA